MAALCTSCGLPMTDQHKQSGRVWCAQCSTPSGDLQPFEERFERMVDWNMRNIGLARRVAEETTRIYMRHMPAWRNHPALQLQPA